MTDRARITVPCFPPRAHARPAPAVEEVWVPEVQTRTAVVLGVKVEIPLQPQPAPRRRWGR